MYIKLKCMINLDKVDIPSRIVEDLENVFKYFEEIEKVVLFGSRARKDNKYCSDIDLAVYGISDNKWKFNDMIEDISTLYSFDIIFISSDTSKKLLSQIKKDGCIIYER